MQPALAGRIQVGAPDPRDAGPQGRRLTQAAGEVVGRIETSLVEGGFKVSRDSVAGRQAVIGRASRLGRRQVFVLVAVFKGGMAGREHLDRFLDEAGQYAATVKGRLAAGAAVVAVAVVEAAEEGAQEWAKATGSGRSSAFPVLVDLAGGRVVRAGTPDDLARLVQEHVAPSLRLV